MVRYVSFSKLMSETFYAEKIEGHRQIWREGSRWTGYAERPRHASGFLFICSPLEAECIMPSGRKIIAHQGDVLYFLHESRYIIGFKNGGCDIDAYTVNFILYDKDNNELRLGKDVEIYSGAALQACQTAASELTDAYLFSESALKMQTMLFKLLDALSGFSNKHSESYYPIRRGVSIMLKEWNKNEKIGFYANACGISETNFYLYFKRWAGKSPIDYRNEIRINAAKSMLTNSDLAIYEIAEKIGFDDPYYFSRFFKKITGVSPRAFRKNENN